MTDRIEKMSVKSFVENDHFLVPTSTSYIGQAIFIMRLFKAKCPLVT